MYKKTTAIKQNNLLKKPGEKEKESALQCGKREAPVFSLFPSSPARLLFFHYCYFYWDTQREPLGRRERCGRKEINNMGEVQNWSLWPTLEWKKTNLVPVPREILVYLMMDWH